MGAVEPEPEYCERDTAGEEGHVDRISAAGAVIRSESMNRVARVEAHWLSPLQCTARISGALGVGVSGRGDHRIELIDEDEESPVGIERADAAFSQGIGDVPGRRGTRERRGQALDLEQPAVGPPSAVAGGPFGRQKHPAIVFDGSALVDVEGDAGAAHDLPGAVEKDRASTFDPVNRAVGPRTAVIEPHPRLRLDRRLELLNYGPDVV